MADLRVTLDDIRAAADRNSGGVRLTQCLASDWLAPECGVDLYLKREHRQRTGSFKERGARNAILRLSPAQQRRGVIAASAGNHALALALHGKLLGVPVTVVMPEFAPLIKVQRCRSLGATVIQHGRHIGEARDHAQSLLGERSQTYINGFDHPDVIAGAGTIGLELLDQVAGLEAVVVPIGGAGLIAGVGLAVKSIAPQVEVIGVEPEAATSYLASLAAGSPVRVALQPTLADGLAVPQVGDNAFAIARTVVDRTVTVNEHELALAILRLIEMEQAVVEGAGAAGVAALLAGKLPELRGRRVATILCGGNIDTTILDRIMQRGLAADGRLCRFTAQISDRPGGLATFSRVLADAGVSVVDIAHDRIFGGDELTQVSVQCTVETINREHIARLQERLAQAGFTARVHPLPQ